MSDDAKAGGPRVRTVLSIDGGGIRGIIPARIVAEIEELTGRPAAALFDLVAGTSTGGMIALALALPGEDGVPRYTAEQILRFYLEEGPRIFPTSFPLLRLAGELVGPKYGADRIEAPLRRFFGEDRLEAALTNVLVTSYDLRLPAPFLFKSWKASGRGAATVPPAHFNYLFREAARATSAAPTYFPPFELASLDPKSPKMMLIDGGVFANNPAMCAYADARRLFPDDALFVVSIGTGKFGSYIRDADPRRWGAVQWVRPLIDLFQDGVGDSVAFEMETLLPGSHERFQPQIPQDAIVMDDASAGMMERLNELATRLVQVDDARRLREVCARLVAIADRRPPAPQRAA